MKAFVDFYIFVRKKQNLGIVVAFWEEGVVFVAKKRKGWNSQDLQIRTRSWGSGLKQLMAIIYIYKINCFNNFHYSTTFYGKMLEKYKRAKERAITDKKVENRSLRSPDKFLIRTMEKLKKDIITGSL